ncbi:DUF3450 family protein [Verrucomicrobia bacterium S94]|nr:DUF3450 family protein [Verrucomicrobia bacterium S94]
MINKLKICIPAFTTLVLLHSATAQKSPDSSREKLLQWIEIKKIISAESAAWKAEKQQLNDLNTIRRKEIEQLDEILVRSETRRTENRALLEKKQAEAESAETRRSQLALRIAELEKQILPLTRKLPAPLFRKLEPEIAALEQSGRPLQERYRDLTAMLIEIGDFNASITLDTEIRETAHGKTEVDILYLGLAHAWYVNRTGTSAGYGIPTSSGWKWSEDPSMAAQIRSAIAIVGKQAPPPSPLSHFIRRAQNDPPFFLPQRYREKKYNPPHSCVRRESHGENHIPFIYTPRLDICLQFHRSGPSVGTGKTVHPSGNHRRGKTGAR